MIELENTISQSNENIVSNVDGEKTMLSIKNSKYYNFDDIGREIWDLIERPISVLQLVSILTSRYEVNQAQYEEQVLTFLHELYDEFLIRIIE